MNLFESCIQESLFSLERRNEEALYYIKNVVKARAGKKCRRSHSNLESSPRLMLLISPLIPHDKKMFTFAAFALWLDVKLRFAFKRKPHRFFPRINDEDLRFFLIFTSPMICDKPPGNNFLSASLHYLIKLSYRLWRWQRRPRKSLWARLRSSYLLIKLSSKAFFFIYFLLINAKFVYQTFFDIQLAWAGWKLKVFLPLTSTVLDSASNLIKAFRWRSYRGDI